MSLGEKVVPTPSITSCTTTTTSRQSLLYKLLAQGTYACSKIRTNRKNFPSEISVEAKT